MLNTQQFYYCRFEFWTSFDFVLAKRDMQIPLHDEHIAALLLLLLLLLFRVASMCFINANYALDLTSSIENVHRLQKSYRSYSRHSS